MQPARSSMHGCALATDVFNALRGAGHHWLPTCPVRLPVSQSIGSNAELCSNSLCCQCPEDAGSASPRHTLYTGVFSACSTSLQEYECPVFDASAPLLPLDKAVANAAEGFMKHLEPLHHHHWLKTKTCDFQNSLNDTHFLFYHGELEEPEKYPMAQLVREGRPVIRVCWLSQPTVQLQSWWD